jgi:predicted transcriptional regulator
LTSFGTLVDKLQDGQTGRVLVAQGGEVVGIITPTDLTRWLRRRQTLQANPP